MKSPIVLYEPLKRARTDYRIGLSAWTEKSLLNEGTFYPRKTMTAEERLWWYSRFFDGVEVNSSFYAISSVETTASWVERTPAGFLFNVKAFGLLTGHHLDAARLPDVLRKMLSREREKATARREYCAWHRSARLGIRRAAQGARAAAQGRQARLRAIPARALAEVLG
jgi:uncharacterized protein YecE (DUF72 family)